MPGSNGSLVTSNPESNDDETEIYCSVISEFQHSCKGQLLDGGDMQGYANDNETVDPAEARTVVERIARLYAR
jgi:hypothetical protein